MNYASEACEKIARETANPQDVEANLLLTAVARLQAVRDSWKDKPAGLHKAPMHNRRPWIAFIDAVTRDDNKLPAKVLENLTRPGMWIMAETFWLMSKLCPII
jgi:flagellar biosynthesis regulator FlaF